MGLERPDEMTPDRILRILNGVVCGGCVKNINDVVTFVDRFVKYFVSVF